MNQLDTNRIMSGTFGSVWIDGEQWLECYGLEARVEIQKEAVAVCGKYNESEKFMGYKGTGTLKLRKVYSRMTKKLSAAIKAGRLPEVEILSEVKDPAAYGAERVLLKEVSFNELILANWEVKQPINEELSFGFGDWEDFDTVEPD